MQNIKMFFLCLSMFFITYAWAHDVALKYKQERQIYVYTNKSQYWENLETTFKDFNISYDFIDSTSKTDQNLYIIFDIFNIKQEELPKYYIVYQTLDLQNSPLSNDYLDKLKGAVAVWDYSQNNIDLYNSKIFNYYFFPKNYEYADPVILPCFLPLSVLDAYKEILIYSNHDNTEISSLIPAIFFHSYIKNPQIIVELGVCLGYSTQAFIKTMKLCGSHLIGIDNDRNAAPPYAGIQNGKFLLMNDLNFSQYYTSSSYKNQLFDIVFIDTSHEYNHTMAEISIFAPLLAKNGMLMFHDSNVTPLVINGRPGFWRINNTTQVACVNPRGVTQALNHFFSLSFDESRYTNIIFTKNDTTWHMIHYPFCNGLTVLNKIQ